MNTTILTSVHLSYILYSNQERKKKRRNAIKQILLCIIIIVVITDNEQHINLHNLLNYNIFFFSIF